MTAEAGRVCVLGENADDAATTLEAGGLTSVVASAEAASDVDADVLVALGESALLSLSRARTDVPVLPVDAGSGVRSVPRDRLGDAATRLRAGDWSVQAHPRLAVDNGQRRSFALLDAMLVTTEPAHISEYTLRTSDDRVARFRADGVVAATPAGTRGYAQAAGAPVVPPGSDVLALVPVAPFTTTLDHWVVPADDVSITVERDDAAVEVLADDRTVGTADVGDPVELTTDGQVPLVRVPEGQSPFARRGEELEKL